MSVFFCIPSISYNIIMCQWSQVKMISFFFVASALFMSIENLQSWTIATKKKETKTKTEKPIFQHGNSYDYEILSNEVVFIE